MKRSDAVTLTLAGVALATSAVMAPDYQRLDRKRYSDRRDCECDYSPAQCESTDGSQVVGPWFARYDDVRRKDPSDPGPGRCYSYSGGGSASGYPNSYRRGAMGDITMESGYRDGFGGTARRGTPPRS